MKLKLIYPTHRHFNHKRLFNIAIPLNLCVLAAHTPPDVEVSLTDAYLEDVNYDEHVDLVGITCLTPSALQAYKIAEREMKPLDDKYIKTNIIIGVNMYLTKWPNTPHLLRWKIMWSYHCKNQSSNDVQCRFEQSIMMDANSGERII